jgi:phosphatidylethanolamine/phosphatidyl-N-methylethanolamine N-methyltransferase
MSALAFLKRFIARPTQVASLVPSSKAVTKKVADRFDFSQPRVFVEFGPGEGCHTRELLKRATPDSQFFLFELDPELARLLERQFAADRRVHVIHKDAATLTQELSRRGIEQCDYVLSGIPFSLLEIGKKRHLLRGVYDALAPGGLFVIYQVTDELRRHALPLFQRAESAYCLLNFPPYFIISFFKEQKGLAAAATNGANGHHGLQPS